MDRKDSNGNRTRDKSVLLRTTDKYRDAYKNADIPYYVGFEWYVDEVINANKKGEAMLRAKIKEAISLEKMLRIQVESVVNTARDLGIDLNEHDYKDWAINEEAVAILSDFNKSRIFEDLGEFMASRYEKNRCIAETLGMDYSEFKAIVFEKFEDFHQTNLDEYETKSKKGRLYVELAELRNKMQFKVSKKDGLERLEDAIPIYDPLIVELASKYGKERDYLVECLLLPLKDFSELSFED